MTQRTYVPPQQSETRITVRLIKHRTDLLEDLLDAVRAVRSDLGVPVQVLRADRIVSWTHLMMAAVHAERAASGGRTRATDPAVEFLLYVACDRQIHRAVAALGARPDEATELAVVALGPVRQEVVSAALRRAGLPDGAPWTEDAAAPDPTMQAAARAWWQEGLDAADPKAVDGALLARMALLALDRA